MSTPEQSVAAVEHQGVTWLEAHLPDSLSRLGPLGLHWWQWLALPVALVVAWGLAALLGRVTLVLARRLLRRVDGEGQVVANLRRPLRLLWWAAVFVALESALDLPAKLEAVLDRLGHAVGVAALFWLVLRGVGNVASVLGRSAMLQANPEARALVPFGQRVLRVLLVAIAVIATLSALGYPVGSIVAGLGIGGLAVALGAQKTLEHLFGTFALGLDRPFHEGDVIKVDDLTGTVERIGLRSTRIRTADRSMVTIPNGQLAEKRLETLSVRDRLRLALTVGLVHEATERQVRDVLEGLEKVLRAQPKLWPEGVTVRLAALTGSALEVELGAWFSTQDWAEFQLIRQELLLAVLRVVTAAGTRLAHPTQTVELASAPAAAGEPS